MQGGAGTASAEIDGRAAAKPAPVGNEQIGASLGGEEEFLERRPGGALRATTLLQHLP
jgi:hypothetical protein